MPFAIIYITNSSEEEARKISNHLLEKKLIACTNIFPITSAYWWEGAIQNEGEWVAIVKTTLNNWDRVRETIEKIHPYEVPCIMKIEVTANRAYEDWIAGEVGSR